MKKVAFTITILLIVFSSKTMNSQEPTDLPVLIPPSPTAFQMTQYGDVAINESTGNINPSIPIYTYKAGRLAVPISLSFQGNGVRVDQAASWTGINWNLNAGGVITRIVRDLDDFTSYSADSNINNRTFYSYQELNALGTDLTTDSETMSLINLHCTGDGIDSEVDIFSFSFPGYSGSFYFDESMQPHLTKNDTSLKIELGPAVINNITQAGFREITIITPDGIKYYFGGPSASEQSRTIYPTVGGGANLDSQTSFYLHKIEHPFGDEVLFEYESLNSFYQIKTAISTNLTRINSTEQNSCSISESSISYETEKEDILYNRITNGKFLSRISSNKNSYEVIFNSSFANSNVDDHYTKTLNNLEVRKINTSEILKKVNLNYIFPHNGGFNVNVAQRFFLKKVSFYDGFANKNNEYSMEYNHPEDLPNRFSFDQDHLGYYNNRGNTKHLPQTNHPKFELVTNLSNKSPDFVWASKGVLTHLYYPTGGHTKFDYEAGIDDEPSYENKSVNFLTYINDYTRNPTDKNPQSRTIGLSELSGSSETGTVINESIIDQTIDINMTNVFTAREDGNNGFDNHLKFELIVEDLTDNTSTTIIKQYPVSQSNSGYNSFYHISNGIIWEAPDYTFRDISLNEGHKYKISLEIIPTTAAFSRYVVSAKLQFNYLTEGEEDQEACGVRVKKTSSFTDALQVKPLTKRYYYVSGNKAFKPQYLQRSKIRSSCGDGGPPGAYVDYYLVTLSSSSLNSLYSNSSNQRMYSKVRISHGGDAYENGGVEKEFLLFGDALPLNYFNYEEYESYSLPNIRENTSTLNGTLKKETVFSNKQLNNAYVKLKETQNHYSFNQSTHITNNSTSKLFTTFINADSSIHNLYLGLYNTYSFKLQLDSTKQKTFDYSRLDIPDIDNDGVADIVDNDSDANGNGINDGEEDFDGDGSPNSIDNDDDNDGITDTEELALIYQPEVLETLTEYQYNQHVGLPTRVTSSTSNESVVTHKEYTYPQTTTNISTYISQPSSTKVKKIKNGVEIPIGGVLNNYSNANNFPNYNGNLKLLSSIKNYKGAEFIDYVFTFEDRIIYHDYDDYGNPLEVSKADGTHITYIWGYNKTLPIAKIENANFSEIAQALGVTEETLENFDQSNLVQLNSLRQLLPNSMVNTYTYDPLIGVTSMTDPRGNVVYYHYDKFNRLEFVKDKDGNILSNNEYNYKN